jgi:hypothetical protein
MDIVEHYSNKPNSFVLALANSCSRLNYSKPELPQLDPEEVRSLKDYVTETWHQQNPDDDDDEHDSTQPKITQTDQRVEIVTDDRRKIEVNLPTNKSQKSSVESEQERDEEDEILDAVLSSVLPFDNSLLVTKIESTHCSDFNFVI